MLFKSKNDSLKQEKQDDSKVITLDDIIGKQEDKNPKKVIEKKEEDVTSADLVGMKEIIYCEEDEKKPQLIENPLPVPKRKEHKALDYAIPEISDEDDFDLQDMSGIDFFDLD